jgi:uncharacterized phosphosugar-binding protein
MERETAAYLRFASKLLARLARENRRALGEASRLVAAAIRADGLVHLFGTGHSSLLAQEAFFRAGGLMNVNPLIELPWMVYHRPLGAAVIERSPKPADRIFRRHRFSPGRDVAILASNSGRNVLPIEVALRLKARGVPTIGIASLRHARSVPSRHPSGKNLVDVVDVVLDNGGAVGDAAVALPDGGTRMGPTSAVAGFALLHAALVGGAARALREGARPAVLESANLKGKRLAEYRRLFRRFCGRVPWLGG